MHKLFLKLTLTGSSFQFSLFLVRHYSTAECSLVKLSEDMSFIYNDLTSTTQFSMSCFRLAIIQQQILNGFYVLSPLQYKIIKKDSLCQFLNDTLPDCPDFMFGTGSDPELLYVVMPDKNDVLVFMAISLMLYRLSRGRLPYNGYRINSEADSFYNNLSDIGKVSRLYCINLQASLSRIPINLVLSKVKPLVGEGSVYKLISSMLSLPIIDEDGNYRHDINPGCLPPVGELTRVLYDIVLRGVFEREFRERFPGIALFRFQYEVYIPIKGNESNVIFDESVGYALLKELNLEGKILSIGHDESSSSVLLSTIEPSSMMVISLDKDSKVRVCNYNNYIL